MELTEQAKRKMFDDIKESVILDFIEAQRSRARR
jgi:hypothetical protein